MVTKTDRFGNPIKEETETSFSEEEIKKNSKTDRFGNIITSSSLNVTGSLNFDSTSSRPKQEREEGILEKYVFDPVTAAVAGVGEGAL